MEGKLYTEAVAPEMLALVRKLMADKRLDEFNLVGGTALALQLGHRKSIDVDLFSTRGFDVGQMAEHLKSQYGAEISRQNSTGVFGRIEGIKFDILTDPYPLIDPVEKIDGIRMLSLRDIGAMKMSAIYDDGERQKDFVDMYKLLEKHPLSVYLEYARRKDPEIHPSILKQSLLYHADVKRDASIQYIGKAIEWPKVVERLRDAFHHEEKVFGEGNQLKNEHRIHKTPRQHRGHRPG
jgi:hypothetical protein